MILETMLEQDEDPVRRSPCIDRVVTFPALLGPFDSMLEWKFVIFGTVTAWQYAEVCPIFPLDGWMVAQSLAGEAVWPWELRKQVQEMRLRIGTLQETEGHVIQQRAKREARLLADEQVCTEKTEGFAIGRRCSVQRGGSTCFLSG